MSFKNPVNTLIEALFRSYPYMELSQRLMIIIAIARALDPSIEKKYDIASIIAKARELELLVDIHINMYKNGELEELDIPRELVRLYDIENKLLSKIFSFYLKPSEKGVNQFL